MMLEYVAGMMQIKKKFAFLVLKNRLPTCPVDYHSLSANFPEKEILYNRGQVVLR